MKVLKLKRRKKMPRVYTGNKDGLSKEGAKPGTEKLVEFCKKRWGFTNLGIFANRSMNNPKATKGDPKWLSVHATGRACDIGYTDRKKAVEAWDWFMKYTKELGIEELHDYAYDANVKDKVLGWGRGYRCSRGEGEKGVKIYDAKDNAGSQGGKWLHIELSPEMANDAAKFEAAWRALPKPGQA
jgi:hypothetical protein